MIKKPSTASMKLRFDPSSFQELEGSEVKAENLFLALVWALRARQEVMSLQEREAVMRRILDLVKLPLDLPPRSEEELDRQKQAERVRKLLDEAREAFPKRFNKTDSEAINCLVEKVVKTWSPRADASSGDDSVLGLVLKVFDKEVSSDVFKGGFVGDLIYWRQIATPKYRGVQWKECFLLFLRIQELGKTQFIIDELAKKVSKCQVLPESRRSGLLSLQTTYLVSGLVGVAVGIVPANPNDNGKELTVDFDHVLDIMKKSVRSVLKDYERRNFKMTEAELELVE